MVSQVPAAQRKRRGLKAAELAQAGWGWDLKLMMLGKSSAQLVQVFLDSEVRNPWNLQDDWGLTEEVEKVRFNTLCS